MEPVTMDVEPGEPVQPSEGWGVSHLYFRVHPHRSPDPARAGKELVAVIEAFEAEADHQVLCSSVLGLKADVGVMALGPDLTRHEALARALGALDILEVTYSFFSLTEISDRKSTRLNSSHPSISYAVFCLKKKKKKQALAGHQKPETAHRIKE